MNLKAILSFGIIALMLFSIVSVSSAHTIVVKNKDSGNSQIAGVGHVKLYDTTYNVKKGETLTLKGVDSFPSYLKFDNFLKFDTNTGHPAYIDLNMDDFKLLEKLFGELTFNIEVREFKGVSTYTNKVDYIKITDSKGDELFKAGSPSNLDNNKVNLNVSKFGDLNDYNSQGFHISFTFNAKEGSSIFDDKSKDMISIINDNKDGFLFYNEHTINGKDYYYRDFPPLYT